jgi:hypothetical protein
MKKTIIFSFLIGLYLGFIIFMPKQFLVFTIEKYLKKENVYLNASYKENLFSLKIINGKIFINGINPINFKTAVFYPLILYNSLNIDNIFINFQNLNIKKLNIKYSIINPFKVIINGLSNFGKIDGFIDLKNRFLKIYIINLTNQNLKSFLRKDNKGYFYYEKF